MSAIISRSFRGCQLTSKRVGFFTTDQLLTKQRPSVQLILQPRITVMSPSDIFSKKILRQLSTDCFVNDNIHVGEEHKNTSPDSSKRNRVTRTVKRIQEKLHEQSVKFGDEHVTVFTELLFESGFPENHVENLLLSQLKVLRSTTGVLQSAISLLKNRGFLIHQIAPVLASHPNLFSGDIGSLQNTIDTLSGLGFKDGRVQDMISRAPELMTVTTNQFTHHIFRFQELFSRTETIKLLSRCPGLLLERWSSLSAKAEYAKEEMGLSDLASLLHCDLLTHPLIHIQTRHTFLTRAGLYPKADDLRRAKTVSLQDFPSAKMMLDTTDSRFASRVAGLPLEEFLVFKKLYKVELADNEYIDSSSDEDDSDDDDDINVHTKNTK